MRLIGAPKVALGSRPASPTASWKIAPEEQERLAKSPREGWWQRMLAWLFLAAGAVAIFVVARSESSEQAMAMGILKGVILVGVAQAGLIYLLTRIANDVDLGPGLKRVRAKIPVEEATPHRIEMHQRGTLTGADEGYLWLDEGTLYFKGLQCAFRLNGEDILDLDRWPPHDQPQVDQGKTIRRLYLSLPSRSMVLHLKPIDPFEDYGTRRRAHHFQVALQEWLKERPRPALESVLPPLELHPSLYQDGPPSKEGLVTGAILVPSNVLLALTITPDFSLQTTQSLASLVQLGSALILLFFSTRFLLQRRLDLSERRAIFLENELTRPD